MLRRPTPYPYPYPDPCLYPRPLPLPLPLIRRAAAGLSWSARPAPQVEVEAVDRLEATFRSRLGLLSSSMCSSPRAAGWLLGGCDPTRSGQVLYPIPTPTQLN